MDGLDLLVQVILFLRLLHLPLNARLNRAIKLPLLDLAFENLDQTLQPTMQREDFEQSLFVFDRDAQLRRERVREMRRVLIAHGRLQRVGLRVGRKPHVLFDELRDALRERLDALACLGRRRRTPHGRSERAIVVLHANRRGALAPFDDDLDLTVLLLCGLQDARDCADGVNLRGQRFVNRGIVLCGEKDRAVGG